MAFEDLTDKQKELRRRIDRTRTKTRVVPQSYTTTETYMRIDFGRMRRFLGAAREVQEVQSMPVSLDWILGISNAT